MSQECLVWLLVFCLISYGVCALCILECKHNLKNKQAMNRFVSVLMLVSLISATALNATVVMTSVNRTQNIHDRIWCGYYGFGKGTQRSIHGDDPQ